jgi:uncharacterized damage-inducible protein DinB
MTPTQQQLRDRLAAVPARVTEAAARAAEPAEGEWSARQIVLHLIAVEDEVWLARLGQLAAEPNPEWPWVEPTFAYFPGDDSLENVVAAFATRRAATVAQLDALDDAGWARTGTHATYGLLDVAGLVQRAVDHDEEHVRALEALGGQR